MFDASAVRTYTILVFVIVAAPMIGLLASIVSRGAPREPRSTMALRTATAAPAHEALARRRENGAPSSVAPAPNATPPAVAASPATEPPAVPTSTPAPPAPTATPARPPSIFATAQVVAFYGSPRSPGLGVLGRFSDQDLVSWLKSESSIYDSLNGDRGVVPALDLIYSMAQSDPTSNGLYVRYLDEATVRHYIQLAHDNDLQIILDLQIGRGEILTEVQKIEPYLADSRVHVAIDPEYAVGPDGAPIATPGHMTGDQINAVQAYLQDLTQRLGLPAKLLVIHQYMDATIVNGGVTQRFPDVDVVLNMDAYGDAAEKVAKYKDFATRPYAEYRSYNVFLSYDEPVASEQQIMALDPQPEMIEYQ